MLKNSSKFENSSHFSYNEYKKKVNKKTNKDVKIFVSVFFAGLLVLLGLAKLLAPNVDIGISATNEIASMDDDASSAAAIDERLKSLKLEDDKKRQEDENMFSPELDEKVVLPQQNKPTVGQIEAENNLLNEQKEKEKEKVVVQETPKVGTQHPTRPQDNGLSVTLQQQQTPIPETHSISRVVVGSYATEKQAEVAKSIMQDAGLGITPVVKNIGGYYTLQVGSYSSKEKAQQMMNNLLKSNFPARVVTN